MSAIRSTHPHCSHHVSDGRSANHSSTGSLSQAVSPPISCETSKATPTSRQYAPSIMTRVSRELGVPNASCIGHTGSHRRAAAHASRPLPGRHGNYFAAPAGPRLRSTARKPIAPLAPQLHPIGNLRPCHTSTHGSDLSQARPLFAGGRDAGTSLRRPAANTLRRASPTLVAPSRYLA